MSRGTNRWWSYTGSKPLAILLLTAVCVGGVYREGSALLGTRMVGARELGAPPIGRYVDVSCDSLEHVGSFGSGQRGYLCRLGGRVLAVVGRRSDDDVDRSQLTGRLREFRDRDRYGRSDTGDVDFIWPDEVLGDPAVVHAYLEIATLWRGRILAVAAMLVGVAAVALARRWRIGPRGRWWTRWRRRPA